MAEDPRKQRYHPAPYAFVPLPQQERQLAAPAGHYRACYYSGRIIGQYKACQPLRIGTGLYELSEDGKQLFLPLFRVQGVPTIPGSSLKGVVRSVVEAITLSCLSVLSVSKASADLRFVSCSRQKSQSRSQLLCPACRLFGAQDYRGHVFFSDARAKEWNTELLDLPPLWCPRQKKRPICFEGEGQTPKGRKFYRHAFIDKENGTEPTELCTTGTCFEVCVEFCNLHEAEIGLLLLAMGYPEPKSKKGLLLKVGSHKPTGCGSVKFELTRVEWEAGGARWRRTEWEGVSARQTASVEQIKAWLQACLDNKEWFAREQYEQLLAILHPQPSEIRRGGYEPRENR